jgi:ubiquinone/menaquinone biosynthesis C-methylase UbiE
VAGRDVPVNQCSKPTGWLGKFSLWRMNASHSKLTGWGLKQISIENHYTILDVGCGGGRTVSKLAAIAAQGKVYGIDFSEDSVATTKRANAQWIDLGRVEVRHGSVPQLPFADGMFNLVTAVETHFWWADLPADMREVLRVLKPGGTLIVIAEIYKGMTTGAGKFAEKYASRAGVTLLSVAGHRELFSNAGYSDVQVVEKREKGWICGFGRKPVASPW